MNGLPTNRELVESNYARLEKEKAELLVALRLAYENLSADISAPALYEIEDAISEAEGDGAPHNPDLATMHGICPPCSAVEMTKGRKDYALAQIDGPEQPSEPEENGY